MPFFLVEPGAFSDLVKAADWAELELNKLRLLAATAVSQMQLATVEPTTFIANGWRESYGIEFKKGRWRGNTRVCCSFKEFGQRPVVLHTAT